jgi:hypothetical protein
MGDKVALSFVGTEPAVVEFLCKQGLIVHLRGGGMYEVYPADQYDIVPKERGESVGETSGDEGEVHGAPSSGSVL